MAGKIRPSLRAKVLNNVLVRSNLSNTDKQCIERVFEQYKRLSQSDMVQVIRCRDCIFWEQCDEDNISPAMGRCELRDGVDDCCTYEHEYCYKGERE